MEMSLKPVSAVSHASGRAFIPGDPVRSVLLRREDGLLERLDCLESEAGAFQLEGPVLCRWSQVFREREASEAETRRNDLESMEAAFLGLYEEEDGDAGEAKARQRLKFFLALQLERKRILKPLASGRYRHGPTQKVFEVPQLEITPELIAEFGQEFGGLRFSR